MRFARDVTADEITGRVFVIHMTNPPAFYAKRQYVSPLDEKNLNRVFPGSPGGSATERLADVVMQTLDQSDFWVDLHGGDIHEALIPFSLFSHQGSPVVAAQAEAMARAYGIHHILRSSSIAGGGYAQAAHRNIPALLAEAGQVGQLDESAVQTHLTGLRRLLTHLGMMSGPLPTPVDAPLLTQFAWVSAPQSGLYYSAVKPGMTVRQGAVGGTVANVFGDVVAEIPVPQDGVVLFAVTSLAINAGDPIFAVAAP
jgi:hypothetical protein